MLSLLLYITYLCVCVCVCECVCGGVCVGGCEGEKEYPLTWLQWNSKEVIETIKYAQSVLRVSECVCVYI